jgi:hypothetical protein
MKRLDFTWCHQAGVKIGAEWRANTSEIVKVERGGDTIISQANHLGPKKPMEPEEGTEDERFYEESASPTTPHPYSAECRGQTVA